jgi:hypothetical protein
MYCQPNKLPDGTATVWGTNDPAAIFGPEGWCTAAEPHLKCECVLDGAQMLQQACLPSGGVATSLSHLLTSAEAFEALPRAVCSYVCQQSFQRGSHRCGLGARKSCIAQLACMLHLSTCCRHRRPQL